MSQYLLIWVCVLIWALLHSVIYLLLLNWTKIETAESSHHSTSLTTSISAPEELTLNVSSPGLSHALMCAAVTGWKEGGPTVTDSVWILKGDKEFEWSPYRALWVSENRFFTWVKGIVHRKMKIPSLSTHHYADGGVGGSVWVHKTLRSFRG